MAQMRVVSAAFQELKQDDPNTDMTLCGLRRLISSGVIPTVRVGRKVLFDYNLLLDYLTAPPNVTPITEAIGQIRKVV